VEREQVLLGRVRALTRLARPLEAWDRRRRPPAPPRARRRGGAAAALLAITDGMVWGWRSHPEWDDEAIALWEAVLAASRARRADPRASDGGDRGRAALPARLRGPRDRAGGLRGGDGPAVGRQGFAELQVMRLAQMALLRPGPAPPPSAAVERGRRAGRTGA
jgi:hypothetical protein